MEHKLQEVGCDCGCPHVSYLDKKVGSLVAEVEKLKLAGTCVRGCSEIREENDRLLDRIKRLLDATGPLTIEEYTQYVPDALRGPWLTDWDKKCPCHIAVFNCAGHFCRPKAQ